MKNDDLSFFNQQLAAMLRDGIPLEGALQRLCAEMRCGSLRDELQALGADLSKGTPMADALKTRQLPELYKRMIQVGVKSGDLPGALTMVADYFQRQHAIWSRLRSILTYPLIVMFMAFLVSLLLAFIFSRVIGPGFREVFAGIGMRLPSGTSLALQVFQAVWIFPAFIGMALLLMILVVVQPTLRGKLLWHLPAFKEARLSRIAASLELLLRSGVNLPDSIALTEQLETNPAAASDLRKWQTRLASGVCKFSDLASGDRMIPPMFAWIVSGAGENLADGFKQAADIYHSRAVYRTEIALYAAMPIASIFLGVAVISQALLLLCMYLPMLQMISNMSGS